MAGEPLITVVGNLVADPEARVSQAGKSWVTFRIASTPRVRNKQTNDFEDGEPLWLGCRAYGEYADNIAASLTKGMRVLVMGRLTQRSYTDNQGQQRTSLDLEVEEVGPSLRFATASVARGGSNGPAGGGYAQPTYGHQPGYGATTGGGYAAPQQPQGGGWPTQPQQQQPQGQAAWGNPAAPAAPPAEQYAQAPQQAAPPAQGQQQFGGGFDDEQPF